MKLPSALNVESMLQAGESLFLAGPDGEKKEGATLLVLSTDNGKTLAQIQLKSRPRPEGLAAADGRLYVSTRDGKLLCFGRK